MGKLKMRTCVGLPGGVEVVADVFGEEREELLQRLEEIPAYIALVVGVAPVLLREAEAHAHRVVHVEHGIAPRPRDLPQLEVSSLVDKVRPVFHEQAEHGRAAGSTLQPEQHGSGLGIFLQNRSKPLFSSGFRTICRTPIRRRTTGGKSIRQIG